MKKLATLALAVAALSLTFNFISCSGGSGSSSDSGSYDSESAETTSGSSSGTSSTGSGSGSGNTSTGSGSGSGSTGSGSGNTSTGSGSTTTQNAFVGKTFFSYVLKTNYSSASSNKAEAAVTTLSFSSESEVKQTQIRSLVQNGTVKENKKLSGETCTYSVSGSTATIATSEGNANFTLSSDGRKLTNAEGNATLANGTVYAYTEASVGSNAKANAQFIVLGSNGNGHFTEKSSKNGTNKTEEDFDFTYTLSGSNFSLRLGSNTATGTLSSDKKRLTIDWGDGEVEEYTKL